jgi:hypothetical protein
MSITLISTVTVPGGAPTSIDFNSIPQTPYTDLLLVISARSLATGTPGLYLKPNGLTTNTSNRYLEGSGSSALSGVVSSSGIYTGTITTTSQTANTFSSMSIYIPNYAGSTNKSFSADGVSENNGTAAYQTISAALWSSTSAISSLSIAMGGGTFAAYSSASLYGITKGSSGGVTVS